MELTSANRTSHRPWVLRLIVLSMPFVAIGVVAGVEVTDTTSAFGAVLRYGWIPIFLLIASLLMDAFRVGTVWRFRFDGEEEHDLEVLMSHSTVPPFAKYTVFVDGEEALHQRGVWRRQERLEVSIGNGEKCEAVMVITGRNQWPIASTRLSLTVDGRELVEL